MTGNAKNGALEPHALKLVDRHRTHICFRASTDVTCGCSGGSAYHTRRRPVHRSKKSWSRRKGAPRTYKRCQSASVLLQGLRSRTLESRISLNTQCTVPNLSIGAGTGAGGNGNGLGVSSSRSVTIRGVAGNNTTGFYLNDTPIPFSLDPRVLDVDRIEVLRGPQGTLFGAGSMGGVVRMITRDPVLDGTSGKAEAEGSYVDHGGGGYSTSAMLNLPLISGSVALRINAFSAFDPGLFTREWGGPQIPLSPSVPLPPDAAKGEKPM